MQDITRQLYQKIYRDEINKIASSQAFSHNLLFIFHFHKEYDIMGMRFTNPFEMMNCQEIPYTLRILAQKLHWALWGHFGLAASTLRIS